jgi:hypothetical protein
VTITPGPGLAPLPAHDQPVTITDPARVTRIAAVIDALPAFPARHDVLPVVPGRSMRPTFRARAAGPALAFLEYLDVTTRSLLLTGLDRVV